MAKNLSFNPCLLSPHIHANLFRAIPSQGNATLLTPMPLPVAAYQLDAFPLRSSAFLCVLLPLHFSAALHLAMHLLCQSYRRSSGLSHRATSRGDAIPWQYIVFLDFSMHPSAIPSHRKSPQCITIAVQRDTVHFNAFAELCGS